MDKFFHPFPLLAFILPEHVLIFTLDKKTKTENWTIMAGWSTGNPGRESELSLPGFPVLHSLFHIVRAFRVWLRLVQGIIKNTYRRIYSMEWKLKKNTRRILKKDQWRRFRWKQLHRPNNGFDLTNAFVTQSARFGSLQIARQFAFAG